LEEKNTLVQEAMELMKIFGAILEKSKYNIWISKFVFGLFRI